MNKYKLEISGSFTKYFLKKIIKNRIKLYYIKEDINKLIIIIDKEDYKKIKKIKTNCKIKIIDRYGYVKLKYLFYKYRFMILFFIFSLFLLLFLSNIIFSVEVVHSKKEIQDIILEDLDYYGISKYHFIVSYNKKETIKKNILLKEKDRIEWLEIDRVGTKYVVHVEEKKLNKSHFDNTPRNIVAKTSAMIVEIKAEEGEIVKKKYDYVEKGDTIISGTIMNKNREVKKIKARGEVYGEVWYKVQVEVPTKYRIENLTGRNKKVLAFIFLNHEHSLEINKYNNYSVNERILFTNPLIPVRLSLLDKKESIIKENSYTISNIDKKALELARSKFTNKEIILEKVLKKKLNKSKIIVDVFFKVKENITDYETITDLNLREDVEKDE